MAITTQTIPIELNTRGSCPTAFVHQNDTNRSLVFALYNNGEAYTPPSGTTCKVAAILPGEGGYRVIAGSSMVSASISGDKITFTPTEPYTRKSGNGVITLILTTSSATLRPINVNFVIQQSGDGADVIAGASDFPATLYSYAEEILETMTSYVTTALLADGAVTLAKLANNSVNSSKIVDGSIVAADLASAAVSTAKIADSAVTTAKIADGAIASAKIADSAVTLAKLDSTLKQDHYFALLETETYPGTTQTISFDSSGDVSQILHKSGSTTLRTDAFTFSGSSITEVRTLSTGQKLTLVTNLSTLSTTVTYAA